ncbi:MAG: hypothetical protein IKL55_02710 [Clostridia bacterium]|nr:hypothetical protein [Clostridia bacterium]
MKPSVNLFSENPGEIKAFLEAYYSKKIDLNKDLIYKEEFENPIDMIDFISCFIDNNNKFKINLWISIDKEIYICVTDNNLNSIIKYFYERYPY